MDFDIFSINPQDAEFQSAPTRNDQPLPKADYRIASMSAAFRDITNGQVIDIIFEIADGQYAGRKVQDNFCIKHQSSESWVKDSRIRLGHMMKCMGITGNISDLDGLVGHELVATITQRKNAKDRLNTYFDYKPAQTFSVTGNDTPF